MRRRAESDRIRLLYVISQLIQGGAERWLYEVARALDPGRFVVEVLTSRLSRPSRDHYLPLLREAGIPVHRRLPASHLVLAAFGSRTGRRELANRLMQAATAAAPGRGFFSRYDLVCPVQVENFYRIAGAVEPEHTLVHLMGNQVQYQHDMYAPLRDGRRHRLLLFNEAQRDDLDGIDHDAAVWPLAMDLANRPELPLPPVGAPLRIGVFTRLSPQKPLEPLLYALQALRRRQPAVEMHVFGRGAPETFGRTLDLLHLRQAVRFRGHAADLVDTVRREQLALGWMLSVDDAMGYAGIEVGALGLPLLFWNLGTASTERVREATGGVVETFSSVAELADRTEALLGSRTAREAAGRALRAHLLSHHDIRTSIGRLEALYERAARGEELARG